MLATRQYRHGPARDAAGQADAGQVRAGDPRRRLTYEPKWDGFRAIVFRDGDEVELGSAATSGR